MKKSTAISIFKSMAITILVLVVGLAVVIGMFGHSKSEIKHKEDEIQRNEAKIEQVEQLYRDLENSRIQLSEQVDLEYVGDFNCTAYCTEKYKHVCGEGHGITASGQPVQAGVSVAVGDTERFPYGTVLYIEGVGIRIVQDTGGGLSDNQIDLAMDTHENALEWGNTTCEVYILRTVGGL